jgi:translation initiation factor IF-1
MGKNKKNRNSQSVYTTENKRDDRLELHGVIEEALPGTWFKVRIEGGTEVLATLSGKMRQNHIHLLPGDHVTVEVSPYDTSRGRVTWRK